MGKSIDKFIAWCEGTLDNPDGYRELPLNMAKKLAENIKADLEELANHIKAGGSDES